MSEGAQVAGMVPTGDRPVVVIGAGPVGLAAAAHLAERDIPFLVLEAGAEVAAAVRRWGHVRLFSDWAELVDPAAARLLEAAGWTRPAPGHPTGAEWVADYLAPLAALLGDRIRTGARVTAVTRRGRDRLRDDRADQPFVLLVEGLGRLEASAVIDASGTTGTPGPLGADGLPAVGEEALASHVDHAIPDLADPEVRSALAGRHVAVVGAGHSALTALATMAGLAEAAPGTRVTWVLRRPLRDRVFGGGDADQLAARGALGARAARLVRDGVVEVVDGFGTAEVRPWGHDGAQVALVAEDGAVIEGVDRVLVLTGFRPDLSMHAEVRLDLDASLQAPRRLAPMIDPNVHSCGSVPPHGAAELAHPEPGLYLAGMKSYGRAPTFLAMTGFEQVRSIVAAIAGDHEAAARVELCLPGTGVCGGSGLPDPRPAADVPDAPARPAPVVAAAGPAPTPPPGTDVLAVIGAAACC